MQGTIISSLITLLCALISFYCYVATTCSTGCALIIDFSCVLAGIKKRKGRGSSGCLLDYADNFSEKPTETVVTLF